MMTHNVPAAAATIPHRYENVVQIRCLYEGVTVEQMLASWHDMLPAKMKEWGLQRGEVSTPKLF
jgi:hypothetical protein